MGPLKAQSVDWHTKPVMSGLFRFEMGVDCRAGDSHVLGNQYQVRTGAYLELLHEIVTVPLDRTQARNRVNISFR